VQVGLGGSNGHAGDLSDFSVAVSFDIVQDEYRASSRGQRRNCSLEIESSFGRSLFGHDLFRMNIVERKLALTSNRVHTVVRHHDIHRQSVQPGRQRASPVK